MTASILARWPLALACAFLASPLTAQQVRDYTPAQCPSCAEWNRPSAPVHVFGNTYWVGTRGLGAILIASPEGHVLIDGGLPSSAPLILDNILALGFDPTDIKILLNSHAHYDHAGGLAELQRVTGARVVATPASARVLERGQPGPDDPQSDIALWMPRVAVGATVEDGDTLRVGPLAITAHITAGHTPGGTT